ncbi:MAG: hypothetical protein J07HN4v3_02785 [Halonotius sp. J07HN4]|jgi:hypothetical protein|nr:MAG: hypothetical protein J07HN4v3_02785 [Halonotius sp. J07HN4]
MKIGWAYLGLAAILILIGAYMGMVQDRLLGDLLMIAAIVVVYVGSKSLADADAASDLVEKAGGTPDSASDDIEE